jgi:hypothetical protein
MAVRSALRAVRLLPPRRFLVLIPVRELQAVETHRVVKLQGSHILDTRLTDSGEVVSLTCRPSFTPRKIPVSHFC